jgi:phosphodiesterase/alkaline phosphatase D-like protein
MTVPNCYNNTRGCDNWATDGTTNKTFSLERADFLKLLDDNNIRNVVSITTDIHFPANILVNDDFDDDGDKLKLHELISGPHSAIPLGEDTRFDPTINYAVKYATSLYYI